MDCLVTHSSVIEAVLEYVALAHPDPLCWEIHRSRDAILRCSENPVESIELSDRFRNTGHEFESSAIFAARFSPVANLEEQRSRDTRGMEQFVLFDLKKESLLEASGLGCAQVSCNDVQPGFDA